MRGRFALFSAAFNDIGLISQMILAINFYLIYSQMQPLLQYWYAALMSLLSHYRYLDLVIGMVVLAYFVFVIR